MTVRIRRGRRTDYEALALLGDWPGVDESPRRSVRLYRNVLADLAYDLYVADDDGTPVGMIAVSYTRVLALGGQRARLEEIAVRPDRRRSGVGRELVEFASRRATKRRARAFDAFAAEADVVGFLEHVGFEPAEHGYRRRIG